MNTKFLFLESMDILGTIPQYHTLLLAFVILWIVWYYVKRRYQTDDSTNDELERKLEAYNPEPLVPETGHHPYFNPKKVMSKAGKRITVDNIDCLNLGTHNYLGLIDDPTIQERAIETVKKYGVGSCGPRGFYGTVDVHLDLEKRLADFMGMEEAVVYSYGFSTVASAIPAFCKRSDIIYIDDKANFSIQKGAQAARSDVNHFKHNNIADLESLMRAHVDPVGRQGRREKIRKFLIIEGVYMNTGSICPLPEMIELCKRYKVRIFIDESITFGALGATGRGVTEYFNVPRNEIDMIMGTLEFSIGSIGGFCVGSSFIIEHHRLSGVGYCFSASLPPLLTAAAITSLNIMEDNPALFAKLKRNCRAFHEGLQEIRPLTTKSAPDSPVKHIYLKVGHNKGQADKTLQLITDKCFENNLAVIFPSYLAAERIFPKPTIKVCISAALSDEDIEFAVQTLKMCTAEVLYY